MASAAQFEANRLNAALSTGPASSVGKARSSGNHLKFGLFSTQNCVRPEESQEYTKVSKALWKDLNPVGAVEQMLAVEIVRAAWRLHRCTVAEAEDGAWARRLRLATLINIRAATMRERSPRWRRRSLPPANQRPRLPNSRPLIPDPCLSPETPSAHAIPA